MFTDNLDVTEMYAHNLEMHNGCNAFVVVVVVVVLLLLLLLFFLGGVVFGRNQSSRLGRP